MEVPKADRRIAEARQLFDDDVVAGHRYGAASKRPNFRQHLERRSESGDLREDLLGSADHLSVLDVVSGLVPRTDQSPVLDRSARQVCAQMSTPPRDREVFAVDVSDRIRSRRVRVLPGWVALSAWQSSSSGHAMAPSGCLWRLPIRR